MLIQKIMSLRTLIVDDDKSVRFFHKLIVTQSGLASMPLSFADGKEVFDYLHLHSQETDSYLVLLDVNMPVMNGWELLQAVKGQPYAQRLYFIMVTSSIDKADGDKAKLFDRVIAFVEKPITDEACKKIMALPAMAEFF